MDNTAADYSNERKGVVFLPGLEETKAKWIAQGWSRSKVEEGFTSFPELFMRHWHALEINGQERNLIMSLWACWSDQYPKSLSIRVWGRRPSITEIMRSSGSTRVTIKKYLELLQSKGLLLVSGDIYDVTPLLVALVVRNPPSLDKEFVEDLLIEVWGKRRVRALLSPVVLLPQVEGAQHGPGH